MPDIIRDQMTTLPPHMLTRYKDMGDGTHAETVSVEGPFTVNDGGGSLTVDDGGGSLTVDGTINATVQEPLGVDDNGGSLTVDDGGGSLTVDGALTATIQEPLSVDDNGSSLTVDGTVTANVQGYRSSDATYQPLRLDKATNTLQTIDYSHHEIHAGSHFFVTDYQTIASSASVDWMLTTPNTTAWAHLTFEVQGSAVTTAVLYEGADRNGTTALDEQNNDRNSATTATTVAHRGTSGGSTDGTAIWQSSGGATAASFRGGADNRQETEIILKQNTKYILRVTSGTNGNIVAVKMRWYEHTNIA